MEKGKNISLSRSCHACIKAKRRCKAGVPKCERCRIKEIECSYVNEPLVSHLDDKQSLANGSPKIHEDSEESRLLESRQKITSRDMEFFHFTHLNAPLRLIREWCYSKTTYASPAASEPTLALMEWGQDLATVNYLAAQLKAFPITFSREAKTVFIHSTLYSRWLPKHIKNAYAICRAYSLSIDNGADFHYGTLHQKLDELIKEYPTLDSFSDLLASLQALLLYLLICIFHKDPWQRGFAETHIVTLNQWTRHVWEQAPNKISQRLSAWEAWAFAESVRRSIIISYMVRGVYQMAKFGFHPHSMFVETLPFDRHTRLWDATSAREWSSLPRDPLHPIISYREYVTDFANQRIRPTSLFELLLLVIRYGKEPIYYRLYNGTLFDY
ncbi:hypothetical protein TRIATDRAFT_43245 [Trichoderma atroviride IMI 206040]|uniref:Zn(2)-C6 fungal-type domain-containing protein n=1 Tax=Hypocrea atroviridis (strain ATCC 20476 / IMI 206040) TaxID=452589 RepID=G9NS01_HYPAI|nr:uncharacterized protein TRIATDRAFT_43245 [Trichoderma atroviride IMI 206040]EHK46781.1 hypothetical protein TRIATDRAFT_43245 [Trichoderma atroviride IMI 206040]